MVRQSLPLLLVKRLAANPLSLISAVRWLQGLRPARAGFPAKAGVACPPCIVFNKVLKRSVKPPSRTW